MTLMFPQISENPKNHNSKTTTHTAVTKIKNCFLKKRPTYSLSINNHSFSSLTHLSHALLCSAVAYTNIDKCHTTPCHSSHMIITKQQRSHDSHLHAWTHHIPFELPLWRSIFSRAPNNDKSGRFLGITMTVRVRISFPSHSQISLPKDQESSLRLWLVVSSSHLSSNMCSDRGC